MNHEAAASRVGFAHVDIRCLDIRRRYRKHLQHLSFLICLRIRDGFLRLELATWNHTVLLLRHLLSKLIRRRSAMDTACCFTEIHGDFPSHNGFYFTATASRLRSLTVAVFLVSNGDVLAGI